MSLLPASEQMRCPYVGKVDDRGSIYNQATRRHRCHRWEQALPVRRQDQEQYCLSPLHVTCPRLTDPNALPVPKMRQRRGHRRPTRLLGMPVRRFFGYIVPMVLLFVAAIGASYILVRHMIAPPLPIALVPALPGSPSATATATPTRFPTWTPAAEPSAVVVTPAETQTSLTLVSPLDTPTAEAALTLPPTPTQAGATPTLGPSPTRHPTATTPESAVGTSTFSSPIFDSPLGTPTQSDNGGASETPTPTESSTGATGDSSTATPAQSVPPMPAPFDFMAMGPAQKTLVPGGIDVCAKVYGRVYDVTGNLITREVAVSVTWWPDKRLSVGEPGSPPVNADGTYEFCLSRGQFNVAVVAHKKTSEQYWIDTDEPDFTGKVIMELNFRATR